MKLPKLCFMLLAIACYSSCSKHTENSTEPKPQPHGTALVVILGSSTAAGEGASPLDSAWCYRIQGVVNKVGVKARFIDLAVPGYTTYHAMPNGYYMADRPAPDTSANITKALSLKPSLVLLSFPSNDIADACSNKEIMYNYSVITHMLDSAKVQYIIFSDQPRNFSAYYQRCREKTMNDTIKNIYSGHFNDFFAPLSTSDFMINPVYSAGDGIHLNNSGHALIMNATLNHPVFKAVVQ
ncbi:MAG: SGNH/GDSL hydrolase family protein [Bacteroidetes bacterium]|nr:SGNH/GDSL hydrolase family protein [Bacteroidota bacterium]